MKRLCTTVLLTMCVCSIAAGQQPDGASKEDIQRMLTLMGARQQFDTVFKNVAQLMSNSAVQNYKQTHPNAAPDELGRVSAAFNQYMQEMSKIVPPEEILDAITAVYQRHLSRSDVQAINDFYSSPSGQKLMINMPEMMMESRQAAQSVMEKHQTELKELAQKITQSAAAGQPQSAAIPPVNASNERVRVADSVSEGLLISQVPPVYPDLARAARIQGTVVLQAVISKDGTIENLSLVSGHPMLAPAAMEAVKQWKYRPYILNGQPVEVMTQINVNFQLK